MNPIELTTRQFQCCEEAEELTLVFSPDEQFIACTDFVLGFSSIRQVPNGEPVALLTQDAGMGVVFDPSSSTIATCGSEGVSIWGLATGEQITRLTWNGLLCEAAILRYDKSGGRLGLLTDRWFRLWLVPSGTEIVFHPFEEDTFAFEEGKRGLALNFIDDEIICFVCRSHKEPLEADAKSFTFSHSRQDIHLTQVTVNYSGTRRPVVSVDGGVTLVCVDDLRSRYELWSLKDCRCMAQLQFEPHMAPHFSFSPDNQFLAQGYHYRSGITIWVVDTGKVASEIQMELPARICYSTVHELLATVINNPWAKADRTQFVDPLKGNVLAWTSGHGMMLTTNHLFSPQGRWFASAVTNNAAPSQVTPTSGGIASLTDVGLLPLRKCLRHEK